MVRKIRSPGPRPALLYGLLEPRHHTRGFFFRLPTDQNLDKKMKKRRNIIRFGPMAGHATQILRCVFLPTLEQNHEVKVHSISLPILFVRRLKFHGM